MLDGRVLADAADIDREFAGGVDHRGYTLTAPLTAEGLLDESAYSKAKSDCLVRRFSPDEDAVDVEVDGQPRRIPLGDVIRALVQVELNRPVPSEDEEA